MPPEPVDDEVELEVEPDVPVVVAPPPLEPPPPVLGPAPMPVVVLVSPPPLDVLCVPAPDAPAPCLSAKIPSPMTVHPNSNVAASAPYESRTLGFIARSPLLPEVAWRR